MPRTRKVKERPEDLSVPPNDQDEPRKEWLPVGSVNFNRAPLKLEYITGKDWSALLINVLIGATIGYALFLYIQTKTHIRLWTVGVPLCIVWVLFILFRKRLGFSVNAREGKLFLDNVTGLNKVYGPGAHFTEVYAGREKDFISFQKHEIVIVSRANNNAVTAALKGGTLKMMFEFKLMYARVETAEALSHSLNYELHEITDILMDIVTRRIIDLAGRNTWRTMLWHKAKAMGWAGAIFAGRKKRSPLEIDLGIEVTLIQVTEMLLVPESQAIVDAEAKGEVMAEIAHDLMDQFDGLMYEDALRMAQTTQGTIVQTITTVDGKSLPKTLEVLAIGSEGNVAIGARRGGR